ncbi:MAG: hypothetical protein AMXMBFR6_24040 [Betaproteobacteria bacterium]|nr:Heme A synthase [Rhodocyclaceae bacterium]
MLIDDRRLLVLHRVALLCVVSVLAVTTLSAFLRHAKAGLGCAEWPACYGQELRAAQRGEPPAAAEQATTAVARLAHRIVATLVLLWIAIMLMVCFGARPFLVRDGGIVLALLALAVGLAVLGRWSSDARVPAVAMANLFGGFAMLALCVRLAATAGRQERASTGRHAFVAGLLLLSAQIMLGGLVSASHAGLSCDMGHCSAAELLRITDWSGLDPWREPVLDSVRPGQPPAGAVALGLHRYLALPVAAMLGALGLLAWRSGRRHIGATLLVLLGAQVVLGLTITFFALPMGAVLLHNLFAASLLATLSLLI